MCCVANWEDIATVAELLFENQNVIRERVEEDEILEAKIACLKNWYKEKTDGKMDEQFWQDYYAGRVTEPYWD